MQRCHELFRPWSGHETTRALPRLESPPEDEADAKAGQGHHFGPLTGILAQISEKIVERPQTVVAVDRLFGCIRHIAAVINDRFSEFKPLFMLLPAAERGQW